MSKARGFTFVELMVTLAILATLAMVAVPMAQVTIQRQKEHDLRAALTQIREAIDAFKRASEQGHIAMAVSESGYPRSLDELADGVDDQRSPSRRKLYFLRRVPRDPFAQGDDTPAARTWGLRSYASPPDNPSEGVDVFDVYSKSNRVGLNGVPHAKW
jgi:general secretion pathway protein G